MKTTEIQCHELENVDVRNDTLIKGSHESNVPTLVPILTCMYMNNDIISLCWFVVYTVSYFNW